jgi:hypothetical protein
MAHPGRRRERGQILPLMAVGIVTMLTMAGLIVDGGFVFSQQRATQNGTDAAANAGAVVLAKGLKGVVAVTDADVAAAISASITANEVGGWTGYYTDVAGQTLQADGTPSSGLSNAVAVGSGTIPPCMNTATCVNGKASGVLVIGTKPVGTYISRIVGINGFTVSTQATAVAGYVQSMCDAEAGCDLMPVTIPVTVLSCDGSNNPIPLQPPTNYATVDANGQPIEYKIPLCQNGPGNVGWLDWTPTAGGTSELVSAITAPNNPLISVPGWYYVTATGNVNSQAVENALNYYAANNIPVLIPQFDSTCNTQPAGVNMGDCPTGSVGGNGSNQWYHLAGFAALMFDSPKGAYISGSNSICDTGNGATSCLIGHFINFMLAGSSVGPGTGASSAVSVVGVQLIK